MLCVNQPRQPDPTSCESYIQLHSSHSDPEQRESPSTISSTSTLNHACKFASQTLAKTKKTSHTRAHHVASRSDPSTAPAAVRIPRRPHQLVPKRKAITIIDNSLFARAPTSRQRAPGATGSFDYFIAMCVPAQVAAGPAQDCKPSQ
jgi:hypothetical protein